MSELESRLEEVTVPEQQNTEPKGSPGSHLAPSNAPEAIRTAKEAMKGTNLGLSTQIPNAAHSAAISRERSLAIVFPQTQTIPALLEEAFVRVEVNFLKYPIGTLDKHAKAKELFFRDVIPQKDGKEPLVVEWQVFGTDRYGIPGPTAIELDDAITRIIMDRRNFEDGKPPKWIATTYYELSKAMGRTPSGRTYDRIRSDIQKIQTTTIISQWSYKKRGEKGYEWFNGTVNKFQFIGQRERNPNPVIPSNIADSTEETHVIVGLTDLYWANLAGAYGKPYTLPIDFGFMASLGNVVLKRIYKLLALAFQTLTPAEYDGRSCINYNYEEFCGRVPLKIWKERRLAKSHLKRYLKKLVDSKYLEKFIFEFDSEDVSKWFVRFFRGSRATDETERISGQLELFRRIRPKIEKANQEKRQRKHREDEKIRQNEAEARAAAECDTAEREREELRMFYEGLPDEGKQAVDKMRDENLATYPDFVKSSKLTQEHALTDAIRKYRVKDRTEH